MRCMVQEDGVANERKQGASERGKGRSKKDEKKRESEKKKKKRERSDEVEGKEHVAARLVLGLI